MADAGLGSAPPEGLSATAKTADAAPLTEEQMQTEYRQRIEAKLAKPAPSKLRQYREVMVAHIKECMKVSLHNFNAILIAVGRDDLAKSTRAQDVSFTAIYMVAFVAQFTILPYQKTEWKVPDQTDMNDAVSFDRGGNFAHDHRGSKKVIWTVPKLSNELILPYERIVAFAHASRQGSSKARSRASVRGSSKLPKASASSALPETTAVLESTYELEPSGIQETTVHALGVEIQGIASNGNDSGVGGYTEELMNDLFSDEAFLRSISR